MANPQIDAMMTGPITGNAMMIGPITDVVELNFTQDYTPPVTMGIFSRIFSKIFK